MAGNDPADLPVGRPDIEALGKMSGHKYDHGHAVFLSGPAHAGGAIRMASRAALRIGAGVVTVLAPTDALPIHAAHLDAIMLKQTDTERDLEDILQDSRITAICAGPGLGADRARNLLPAILSARRPTLLDADALTHLGDLPLHDRCVLTPHMGEFGRLFPDLSDAMKAGLPKAVATRKAAHRAGCTVLLKGPDTVIADPAQAVRVDATDDRAAPWLATAGAGDVLSGMITGLLARGFPPFRAAETAAWLHISCARTFGPGLIAEDLPDLIPAVLRDLGL